MVNKVLYLKFCEDLQHLKPRGVGPVRLSRFEISKVPPTPTILYSGGNLRILGCVKLGLALPEHYKSQSLG